jgi:hypothetical protein
MALVACDYVGLECEKKIDDILILRKACELKSVDFKSTCVCVCVLARARVCNVYRLAPYASALGAVIGVG